MPVLLLASLIKSRALTQTLRWKSLFGAGKLPQNSCGSRIQHQWHKGDGAVKAATMGSLQGKEYWGLRAGSFSLTSQQELCLRNVDNKYHTLQLRSLIKFFYSLCFDLFKDPSFCTLKIK